MIKTIIYTLLAIMLVGCIPTKEVVTKRYTYNLKGKEVKAFKMSEKAFKLNNQGSRVFSIYQFPPKDSVITKTTIIEGKTDTIKGETIIIDCDSIADANNGKAGKVIKPSIVYINRTDTFIKDSIIVQLDTRELDAIIKESTQCKSELINKEKQNKNLMVALIIVSVLLLGSLFLNFRK